MSVALVFVKQKTAYGVRISDWSSDVCSSDPSLAALLLVPLIQPGTMPSFGGNLPGEPWSLGAQAAIFAAAMGSFALLRWSGACLGARLAAHCGMGLRSPVHARTIRAKLDSVANATPGLGKRA